MSPTVQTVLNWGRPQAQPGQSLVDKSGQFTTEQTEALRRELRAEYCQGNRAIVGDWRRGYELMLGQERVGVTNGYGRFRVYYRCNGTAPAPVVDIPFDGSPVPVEEWADDYAIPVYR